MKLKEQVINFLKTSKPEILSRSSKYKEILLEVLSSTSFLNSVSMSQRLWHILNDYLEPFKCIGGNTGVSFISLKKGYRSCCKNTKCICWNNKKEVLSKEMKRKNDNGVMSNSLIKSYGVSHPFQSDEIKEKAKRTILKKYGVKNTFQSEEIKDKIKNTLINRYDVTHPMKDNKIKLKWESTVLHRYDVIHPFCLQSSKEKAQKAIIDRYGVNNFSHYHLIDILPKIQSQEWWNERSNILEVREIIGNSLSNSNLYLYAHKFRPDWDFKSSISQPHQRVIDLLNEYQIEYEVNNRSIISPKELDIYIPSHSLAIEVNGVYWHSELNGKDNNYHLNKTIACEMKVIQLLQFWDIEIENKWDIVSSIILSKLGIYKEKIGARKCKVIQVSNMVEKYFLNENHLQGYVASSICYGLEFNNELVSLMSFRKPRYNNKAEYELLRFCNKINTTIIGGASKLFNRRPEGSIITYADRRYSNGNLYQKLKMKEQIVSSPNYFYTKDYQTLESRLKYQKHKLSKLLESFNPEQTEWENMKANGFDRIWDCGNLVFTK